MNFSKKQEINALLEKSKNTPGRDKYVTQEALLKMIKKSNGLKRMHREGLKGGGRMSMSDALSTVLLS